MTSVKIERRERRQHRQVATSDVDDSDDDARICEYMREGRNLAIRQPAALPTDRLLHQSPLRESLPQRVRATRR